MSPKRRAVPGTPAVLRLAIIVSGFGMATSVAGYEIRVGAAAEPKTGTIGDRIAVVAEFDLPAGFRAFPAFAPSATAFGEWEVLEIRPADPVAGPGGTARQRVLVVLTAWSATLTATPALPFRVAAPGVRTQEVVVPPVAVTLESVLAKAEDTSNLRPPRGMIEFRSWFWWIVAGLLVVAVVAGWFAWRRWRRIRALRAAGLDPARPPRPPEELAREALAALLASDTLATGGPKAFYSALGDLLRRYLEGRFGVPALDRTTAELLPELRHVAALRPHQPAVRDFFETCDLVKFARFAPDAAEVDADVARVREIVDGTAPRRAAPEPAAAVPGARA